MANSERLRGWRPVTAVVLWALFAGAEITAADRQPRSLAYVLQADGLARSRVGAMVKLAECGRDWLVLDASFDGSLQGAWTAREIDRIRQGKHNRRVLCYLSIGEAEDYRWYWRDEWDADHDGKPDPGAPAFLDRVNPDWEGNYKVRYWHADWQSLVLHSLDKIIEQGFDGVYLDIVDAFEYYEYDSQSKRWLDDRVNDATGNTFRQDMIDWVRRIAAHAHRKRPGFLIVPQNGEQLLMADDYLKTIDAIGVEDLFTDGNRPQPARETERRLAFLRRMRDGEKPVFVIEYGRRESARTRSSKGARRNGFVLLLTTRELDSLGRSPGPIGN